MERVKDNFLTKFLVCGFLIIVTYTVCYTTQVRVNGRQLLVNGSPFIIKGFCYHPIPVGQGPNYVWVNDPNIYNTDFPLIKDTGANCIRLYDAQCTTAMLDAAYSNGLYVILALWVNYDANLADSNVRNQIKNDFVSMVNQWKNHPAILMWCIGNEQNYFNGNNSYWYTLVNECAMLAHQAEGTNYHPVTSVNGEIDTIGNPSLKSDDASMQYLDVWGANIYRGPRFYTLFDDYSRKSSKPFWVGEFGCDAWNGQTNREDEEMQARYLQSLWQDMVYYLNDSDPNKPCIGGTVMEWSDEWWQYPNGSWSVQDTAPNYYNPGYVDDPQIQFEWQGVVAITAGSYARRKRQAYFTLQTLWGGTGVDNPPNVSLSINNNQIVSGLVTITANVTDDKGISKVEFYLDNSLRNTDTTSPYTWSLDTWQITNGTHSVKVIAYDTSNQTAEKNVIIIVQNTGTNNPPQVRISSPTNNATVSGYVNIIAEATDDISVNKVEFYIDNNLYITDTEFPYTWQWNTTSVSNGQHTIKVKAYDNTNQTAEDVINVIVSNESNTDELPTITILVPENNSSVYGNVNIVVSVSDDKGISKVEFYINDNLYMIFYSTNTLHIWQWDTRSVSNGQYIIKAKVYDTSNQTKESSIVVNVDNNFSDAPPNAQIQNLSNYMIVSDNFPIVCVFSDDKKVEYVEIYIDNVLVKRVDDVNNMNYYVYNWNTEEYTNGVHSIMLKVYDSIGQVSYDFFEVIVNNQISQSETFKENEIVITPNPFRIGNEEVKIKLKKMDTQNSNKIKKVEIYNLSGCIVKSLDLRQEGDDFVAVWDGKNFVGDSVKSGIYICRIVMDKEVSYKKIVVIK